MDILSPWLLRMLLSKLSDVVLEARVEKDSTPEGAVEARPRSVIAVKRLIATVVCEVIVA